LPFYGVQFHPEVTHTPPAATMLFHNFLYDICKVRRHWTMGSTSSTQSVDDPASGGRIGSRA
jgi:hypothetical protein